MDYVSPGPYPSTCLSWLVLPGAYDPAIIALKVTGARKRPLHDKAVVLEEDMYIKTFMFKRILRIADFRLSR
jgi:hypothetical protein